MCQRSQTLAERRCTSTSWRRQPTSTWTFRWVSCYFQDSCDLVPLPCACVLAKRTHPGTHELSKQLDLFAPHTLVCLCMQPKTARMMLSSSATSRGSSVTRRARSSLACASSRTKWTRSARKSCLRPSRMWVWLLPVNCAAISHWVHWPANDAYWFHCSLCTLSLFVFARLSFVSSTGQMQPPTCTQTVLPVPSNMMWPWTPAFHVAGCHLHPGRPNGLGGVQGWHRGVVQGHQRWWRPNPVVLGTQA